MQIDVTTAPQASHSFFVFRNAAASTLRSCVRTEGVRDEEARRLCAVFPISRNRRCCSLTARRQHAPLILPPCSNILRCKHIQVCVVQFGIRAIMHCTRSHLNSFKDTSSFRARSSASLPFLMALSCFFLPSSRLSMLCMASAISNMRGLS